MRFFAVISLFLAGFIGFADAAAPQQRRGQSTTNTATASTGTTTTGARAAVSARAARTAPAASSANASAATGARAAVSARAGKTQTVATTTTKASAPAVSARAATKTQSVKGNSNTKVATAGENVLVNSECTTKYEGCMNAFCMMENVSGGRCLCSDRITELDQEYAEIEKMKDKTLQLSTTGMDILEMGDVADDVLKNVQSVTDAVTTKKNAERKKLTDSLFDLGLSVDEEDIFGSSDDPMASPIDGKTGNELRLSAHDLCVAAMPAECANDLNMISLVYTRKIASDCSAYENSIKNDKIAAQKALTTAEQEIRSKALEQYQAANKYDLGQCTVEFRKCMATTAGCEEDFTGCVGITAAENAKKRSKTKGTAQYVIKGSATQISIAASSYDTLLSKKPICESVTKNCTRVKDQVWDTFLKEIAPTIKSAELIAEDDLRQSCMSNITDCMLNACKDNIDPNREEESYDLCLAYPDSVASLCKVQIEPCQSADPNIMDFVKRKLSAMRVDACTNQVKSCLQSADRCGPDYANCIGLDLEAIRKMCPQDLLTSCVKDGEILEDLDDVLMGIYLNMDNSALKQCQKLVNKKIVDICGDSNTCYIFGNNTSIGKTSLSSIQDPGTGNYKISGMINFSNLKFDQATMQFLVDEYMQSTGLSPTDSNTKDEYNRIKNVIDSLNNEVDRYIAMVAADTQISYCVNGRDMSQITGDMRKNRDGTVTRGQTVARFPNLLQSYRGVFADGVYDAARNNYDMEYARLYSDALGTSDDYKNQLYCNAMVNREKTGDVAKGQEVTGVLEQTPTSITISSVKTSGMLDALLKNTEREEVITVDGSNGKDLGKKAGMMIGRRSISSVYEPGTKTCHITTTTVMCTGMEAVYNGKSDSWGFDVGASYAGVGGNFGMNKSESSNTYQGNFCKSFAEPIISEQLISFAGGSAQYSNTTRSNLTSYYNDQSSTVNDNSKGGVSIGLSAGQIGNSMTNNLGDDGKVEASQNQGSNNKNKTSNRTKNRAGKKGKIESSTGNTDGDKQ